MWFGTYTEQRTLHVEGHLVVVKTHYAHEGLKGGSLNVHVITLSSLADDLHDVVAFTLQQGQPAGLTTHAMIERTSRSKLSRTNSREFKSARSATNFT